MAPIFAAAGMLAGGLMSYFGQKNANETNREIQNSINAQNLQLTHEAWAREDMAVRRRKTDLERAGLSPVLAAGDAAQSSAPIKMESTKVEDELGGSVSNSINSALMMAQLARTEADVRKVNAETFNTQVNSAATKYNMDERGFRMHLDRAMAMKQMGVMTSQQFRNEMETMKTEKEKDLAGFDLEKARETSVNPRTGSQVGRTAADIAYPLVKGLETFSPASVNKRIQQRAFEDFMKSGRVPK